MIFWIVTDDETILLVHTSAQEGAIEVDAPDDFIDCGDTENKYKYVNGLIVINDNYNPII
jgi:hypothetical protein